MLSRLADEAARAFGYPRPTPEVIARWLDRIPPETRRRVFVAVGRGIVAPVPGRPERFMVPTAPGKGPYGYGWFSRARPPGVPTPNWEYQFQIGEYVKLLEALGGGYTVGWEDDLMDITMRRDGRLEWCVEVKTTPALTRKLLRNMLTYANQVPLEAGDRGNDALRKAKYLVRHRPPYLSLVGGEQREHFVVTYDSADAFGLTEIAEGPETILRSAIDRHAPS